MAVKRPIDKQPATDQVFLGNRPPPAAVVAVVTVIAHREEMLRWHCVALARIGEIITPRRVTTITIFRRHDAAEPIAACKFVVHINEGGINLQRIPRQAAEALNKKGRPTLWIARNSRNIIRAENKDVAAMRFHEIVTELIHEDLVPGVDRPLRDRLSLCVVVAGKNFEVLTEGVGRSIDKKVLPLTDDPGKGKK